MNFFQQNSEGDSHATDHEEEGLERSAAVPGIIPAHSDPTGWTSPTLHGLTGDGGLAPLPDPATNETPVITEPARPTPWLGVWPGTHYPSNQQNFNQHGLDLPVGQAADEEGLHCTIEVHVPAHELCTHAVVELHSALEVFGKYGAEAFNITSAERQEVNTCHYPVTPCPYCKRGVPPPFLENSELLVCQQFVAQASLGKIPLLAEMMHGLPRLQVEEVVDDSWYLHAVWGFARFATCSNRLHLAQSKLVIDLLEFMEATIGMYDIPDRARLISSVSRFVETRRSGGPIKGIVLQAVTALVPSNPIVEETTQGGPPHLPLFVVQLSWLGLDVLITGAYGEGKRLVQERAYETLTQHMKNFRLTGATNQPFFFRNRSRGGALGDDCPCCGEIVEGGASAYVTPCRHHFHGDCYDQFLANGVYSVDGAIERLLCPICRAALGPERPHIEPLPDPAVIREAMRGPGPAPVVPVGVLQRARGLRQNSIQWFQRAYTGPMPLNAVNLFVDNMGPVFGNNAGGPCGLVAVLAALEVAVDEPLYHNILIDHDLLTQGADLREGRQRVVRALEDRMDMANRFWRENGIGRAATFAELRRLIIHLNLDIAIHALRVIPNADRLEAQPVTVLANVPRPANYEGPRLAIFFQPPALGQVEGHFMLFDARNVVRRRRGVSAANALWQFTGGVFQPAERADPALVAQYTEAIDVEQQLAQDVPDLRNPRYAAGRAGRIRLGDNVLDVPAPGVPIEELGGDFSAPAAREEPPHAVIPLPLESPHECEEALEIAGGPLAEVGCLDILLGRRPPEELVLAEAVFVSTVNVPAFDACHWVRIPTRRDTRADWRPAGHSCTCHFNPFQLLPCHHIRQAKFLILGPGYKRILSSASLTGYYTLLVKTHYYASLHGGQLTLCMSNALGENRAFWTSSCGGRFAQPELCNPAGTITSVHFSGRPIPLSQPVVARGADGGFAMLVRPMSNISYMTARVASLIEGFSQDFNICMALKGAGVGVLYRLMLQLGDPGIAVLQSVAGIWNHAVASFGLHSLLISLPHSTLIGHLLGWVTSALSTIGVPIFGQLFVMCFVGLAIKVVCYHLFRDRFGISGPWSDVAFISVVGLEATPVAIVRWLLTQGTDPDMEYGVEQPHADPLVGDEPEMVAARDAVTGYARARSLTEPATFRAAATGLIAYNRASHLLRPNAFDTLVAHEADQCYLRRRLGGGSSLTAGAPPRGACFNYPFCREPNKKSKHQRNFNLCKSCLRTHPNRPGQEPSFERGQAVLDGVRITGRVPLLAIRSRYYESPDGTVVFVPPGCQISTNVRNDEFKHPEFCKVKKVGLGIGYVHPGWIPSHQHAGISAVLMGLFERTFQYGQPYNLAACERFSRFIDLFAERTPDGLVDKMPDEDWLKTQQREPELRVAMAALRQDDGFHKEDGEIGLFCKSEWLNSTKAGLGPFGDSKPRRGYKKRGIYTPKDKAHCAVGTWAKPMQKHVAEVLNIDSGYMYAGKATPGELNLFAQKVTDVFDRVHVLMADISRCETNKHPGVVEARMRYYSRKWSRFDHMRDRVIYAWKRGKFRCKQGIGRASGTLPPNMTLSGEDFTSVDNSFDIAMATMMMVYCVLEGKEPEDLTDDDLHAILAMWDTNVVFGAGNGDDTTVVIPRVYIGRNIDQDDFLREYQRVAIKLGFLVTGKWSRGPWDVVFLGMRTYYCNDGKYRFGRLIGRSSVKNHFARDLQGDPYSWLYEVASAEAMTQPHVPLLYHKAAHILKVLRPRIGGHRPLRLRDLKMLEHSARWLMCDGQGVTYTERTWVELAECYGLSVELLKAEVERIQCADWFPYALSGEVWERIFTVDTEY